VIDVGPRQQGREHGPNVLHVDYDRAQLSQAIARYMGGEGWQVRFAPINPYGGKNTGKTIAKTLAGLIITPEFRRKLIVY
jgi:hypothetical protein